MSVSVYEMALTYRRVWSNWVCHMTVINAICHGGRQSRDLGVD